MNHTLKSIAAIAIAALLSCSGCGPDRPETAPVEGRVTFNGKRVPMGTVTFHPKHGRPAIGEIGPDGHYKLTTFDPGDGAPPGEYTVTIEARRVETSPAPKNMKDEVNMTFTAPKVEWLVPEIFSRRGSSPLKAEVVSGSNSIDFTLP